MAVAPAAESIGVDPVARGRDGAAGESKFSDPAVAQVFATALAQVGAPGHLVLSDAEVRQVLVDWNGTAVDEPTTTIPELFAAQAARTPDAVAVTCEGAHLTYRELDERTNRLAHHLVGLGAGPERIVALRFPRSLDQVVAVLAVLKSGAAYLPLDAAYPEDRIAATVADARPVAVLSEIPDLTGLPATPPTPALRPAHAALNTCATCFR